jgi:hypothetical protein
MACREKPVRNHVRRSLPNGVTKCARAQKSAQSLDERGVTFRVKDYRVNGPGRHTTMTLETDEFIRRFLIHVLPKGQHRIRHYGFFGNGNRAANIARIRDLLGDRSQVREHVGGNCRGDTDHHLRVLALPCPCCGGRLIIVDTFAPAQHPRAPPASARAA